MGRYNFNQRTRDGYEISPEQAAKWLERNDNNRNVNVAKVKKMAKDMREGHWDTTHQGIAIASDGTLVDGQHRLLAIVESGVTVRMNVTFNAAKSQHIDSGNIRSMANRVQMSEYDMSWTNNTILSAANLIGRVFAGSNLSHEEALSEWLMKYRTQIESATKCIKKATLPELNSLIDRIVTELVLETRLYIYNAERGGYYVTYSANRDFMTEVTNEELKRYPEELRPQLTGKLMKIDISEPSYKELLQNYAGYKNAKNDSTKMFYYNMFRQGLDILDLDDFTYQMLEMNPNSMGFWLPPLVEGLYGSAFFKVPDTKILRVPITMLQLTRLGFETLNPVTKEIVNRYCQKVFHLDGYEDYFIKTGTYSSKYEFRNAHIHNPKEINEMGEYFLFLNHLTCSMASPLNNRCFYGANTTNEWVVREYIKDKENNPTIYNGLPLHTEYRVFVDFDTKEILGASPYWRSDVMKNEFKKVSSPQERHDYVVYKMHEDILNQRYHESVQTVLAELKKVIPRIELTGQWSVDVMRNGNDYYIIDMALAENSALNDCVPSNRLRAYPQQWLPGESNS